MNLTLRLTTQSLIRALRVALIAKTEASVTKAGKPEDGIQ